MTALEIIKLLNQKMDLHSHFWADGPAGPVLREAKTAVWLSCITAPPGSSIYPGSLLYGLEVA